MAEAVGAGEGNRTLVCSLGIFLRLNKINSLRVFGSLLAPGWSNNPCAGRVYAVATPGVKCTALTLIGQMCFSTFTDERFYTARTDQLHRLRWKLQGVMTCVIRMVREFKVFDMVVQFIFVLVVHNFVPFEKSTNVSLVNQPVHKKISV
jgi:hypothetical protein